MSPLVLPLFVAYFAAMAPGALMFSSAIQAWLGGIK